jgi:hypothetical protein
VKACTAFEDRFTASFFATRALQKVKLAACGALLTPIAFSSILFTPLQFDIAENMPPRNAGAIVGCAGEVRHPGGAVFFQPGSEISYVNAPIHFALAVEDGGRVLVTLVHKPRTMRFLKVKTLDNRSRVGIGTGASFSAALQIPVLRGHAEFRFFRLPPAIESQDGDLFTLELSLLNHRGIILTNAILEIRRRPN